ncbi:Mobile element protein [Methanosarcina sp. Kolksee]|nr:Mobile element protein [Methanosarcina sp. Kolksee]
MKSLISVIFLASIKARVLISIVLLIGFLSYKLTENFSIKEAGKWLNQKEILDIDVVS